MKPSAFEYHDPATLAEAVQLVAEYGDDCKVLAGGQSLMPILSLRLASFPHIIDLNKVGELSGIEETAAEVTIGAMTRQATVAKDATVAKHLPLLATATQHIGHFQIRNRGTIGGSISHADSASEYPAVAVALGATLHAASSRGTRSIAAADFFQGLWTTALESDEILTRISFPKASTGSTNGFAEIARRSGDFAVAGAAAHLEWNGGAVSGGRIVVFAVDSSPRAFSAGDLGLLGANAGGADLDGAAQKVSSTVDPVADIHGSASYRRAMAGVVVRRAVTQALSERKV